MKNEVKDKFPMEMTPETKRMGLGVRHIQAMCMCLCVTALFIVRSSMGVAVLAMTDMSRNETVQVYNWDKTTQGIILSSFFWGYSAMQIPIGVLTTRFGGKPILLFALLANGVLCLLMPVLAAVGNWQLVCLVRVLIGATQACTFPASHTLLGRWLPGHERVLLSGLVYGGTSIGVILGLPAAGFLASTSLGWPLVFYAMGTLLIVVAGFWYWLTASSPSQHRLMTPVEQEYIERNLNLSHGSKPMRTPWRHILTSLPVWAIVVAHFGAAYMFMIILVDMPSYLEKGLGISLKSSASLSALPYIGTWIGGIVASALCEKLTNKGILSATASKKVVTTIGAVGAAGGLLGLALGPRSNTLAIIWLVASLTFAGVNMAGFMVNHLDLSPNLAGLLLAVTNFIANVANAPAPILTGYILQNDPTNLDRWKIVFIVAAAIALAANAFYVTFGSCKLQPWDDPNFLEKNIHADEIKPVLSPEEKAEAKKTSNT